MGTAAPEKTRNALAAKSLGVVTLQERTLSFLSHPTLHAAILVGLVLACFGRTIGSYFLADDIGQVKYISAIWSGNLNLLWSNFTGNYMQIAGMSVFRPTLLLTLVLDYGLWHANAAGYYVSNLFYFAADSVLFYLILCEIGDSSGKLRARFAAFLGAALFAVSPLHCESISWVVGRVDSACCFFYLSSLLCFLRSRYSAAFAWRAAAVALFLLAITTKEMAIGLPVLLFGIAAVNYQSPATGLNIVARLKAGWDFSRSIWISTVVYFICRYLALGTLVGGYTGSIGATQGDNAISRWLDGDTVHRLLFPFAHDVFPNTSMASTVLLVAYSACAALILVRVLSGGMAWRLLVILSGWAITAMVPIYKLWGIGYNLEGARFCFFLSLSLSAVLPLVLLAPNPKLPSTLQQRLDALSVLVLSALVFVLAKTAYSTNLVWVHAGKEVRAVSQSANRLVSSNPDGKKMILLGVPKEHCGAHMILNGDTLKMMLGKPLNETEAWPRFVTFDPLLFGPDQYINASRFRRALSDAAVEPSAYVWSSAAKNFEPISFANHRPLSADLVFALPGSAVTGAATDFQPDSKTLVSKLQPSTSGRVLPYTDGHAEFAMEGAVLTGRSVLAGDGIRLSGIQFSPLDYDFLQFQYKAPSAVPLRFAAKWAGEGMTARREELLPGCVAYRTCQPDAGKSGQWNTMRIRLSRQWRWFAAPTINQLLLLLPPVNQMSIRDLKVVSAHKLVPTLVGDGIESTVGCLTFSDGMKLRCDASAVTGAKQLQLEISKCNYFFDNYEEANEQSAVQVVRLLQGVSGEITLTNQDFPETGYYQVRVKALGDDTDPVGEYSDPVTLVRN